MGAVISLAFVVCGLLAATCCFLLCLSSFALAQGMGPATRSPRKSRIHNRAGHRWSMCCGVLAIAGLAAQPCAHAAATPATTTTALALSNSQATRGTVVTLTASVTASQPITNGQVNFCDAAATYCTDIHLLGTAQLTGAGTAVLKFVPGLGSHSYKAVFAGTSTAAASTSATYALDVTGTYASTTTLASSGSAGSYTLSATVTGAAAILPTGSVSFVDTSNANSTLATASLGSGTSALNLLHSASSSGDDAYSVAIGDFNGDGHPDVVLTNIHDSSLTVLLGNGDGTFTAAPNVSAGPYPTFLAVGDFNQDGNVDLAVASANENTVVILLGKGDGTFTTGSTLPTGSDPSGIAVGDLNGDGKADLAVVNYYSNTVTVLLGNGDGTFTAAANAQTGGGPNSVVMADFNGDGKLDLAVANYDASTMTVLLGNGNGTFTAAAENPTPGTNPIAVATGDFNGDGKADLAVANYSSNTLTILLGNGDGTFAAEPNVSTGPSPSYVAVADFNGDGNADLVEVNLSNGTVTVLLGKGDGTFTAANTENSGAYPEEVLAADFNGDGYADVTVANDDHGQLTVFLAQSTQTAAASASSISPAGVGTHLIKASYAGDNNYAPSNSATTNLTAEPTTPTLTLSAPMTATYGNIVQLTASLTDPATGQQEVNSGTVAFSDQTATFGSQPVSNGTATQTYFAPGVGTFTLMANFTPADDTMNKTAGQAIINITSAPLTFAAASATRVYGTANPQFAGVIAGALHSDTFVKSFTTAATQTSPVGSYAIVPSLSGANLGNYTLSLTNGTLTIAQAPLQLSAQSATRVYGAANPQLTGYISGVVNSDTFTESFTTIGTPASPVGTYTIVPAVSGAAIANYALTVQNGTLTITQAPLTATVGNVSRPFGAPNPTFSGSLSGAVNGDEFQATYSTTAIPDAAPGVYPILVHITGAQVANYALSADAGTLTITKAATQTVVSQATPQADGSLVLQAQVTPSTGSTPTGTVRFFNGVALLGEAPLQNGIAALPAAPVTASSTESIQATYTGDADFLPSTSQALPVAIAPPTSPSYGISATATPSTQTVNPAGQAVFSLQVSPTGSNLYPGVVSFAVAGLPAGATATFSPATLAPDSGPQTVALSVQMLSATHASSGNLASKLGGAALALVLLPFARARRIRKSGRQWMLLAVLILGGFAGGSLLSGCGVHVNPWSESSQSVSYTLTIKVASGAMQHNTTATLLVNPVDVPAASAR